MKTETLTIEVPKGFQIDSFDTATGVVKFKEIPKDIKERIKTFDDVLEYHGIGKRQTNFLLNGKPDENAYRKLKLIAQALNEGWEPDWDDSDQKKYYPWFKMASGGFSYAVFANHWTDSAVGSRLCFKSADLAKYAAETFTDIYKEFFTL